jgi:hypothetical protein
MRFARWSPWRCDVHPGMSLRSKVETLRLTQTDNPVAVEVLACAFPAVIGTSMRITAIEAQIMPLAARVHHSVQSTGSL